MVQEGASRSCPSGGLRPVELAQHAIEPGRRDDPCRTPSGDISAMRNGYARVCTSAARSTSRSSTGGPTSRTALDMHNSRQSFVSRQRMLDGRWPRRQPGRSGSRTPGGRHATRPGSRAPSRSSTSGWTTSARARNAARPEPPAGSRRRVLHRRGREDRRRRRTSGRNPRPPAAGAVHQAFPIHSTSRIVAGGPFAATCTSARSSRWRRRSPAGTTGLAPKRRRARTAQADLPGRRLRLLQADVGRP